MTVPYFDDAGVYHAPDGAVLFVPGSACVGFDASHVSDPPPACDVSPDAALNDRGVPIACSPWPSVPTGFPINFSACIPDFSSGPPDGGHCMTEEDTSLVERCPSADAVGDAYCQAWAQQFVVTGKAVATCDFGESQVFGSDNLICFFSATEQLIECTGTKMVVEGTDAAPDPVTGVVCRYPCEP